MGSAVLIFNGYKQDRFLGIFQLILMDFFPRGVSKLTKKIGPVIGSAVMTFIGNKQTDNQVHLISRCIGK